MRHIETDDTTIARLREGATVVRWEPALFRIEGPGAVACVQGLLTNDVEKPGPGSLVYGALLTPKGMIVLDLWSLRDVEGFTFLAPATARGAAVEIFRRSLPPRLARATDLTGVWSALLLLGPRAADALPAAGLGDPPTPGSVAARDFEGNRLVVGGGTGTAWFRAIVAGPAAAIADAERRLVAGGVAPGSEADAEAARILAGWPALGAEIGEKTLPQEVRFDETGGVSYTKGCYTGQETVARVHFRGHPNRELRGLVWTAPGALDGAAVVAGEKEVGQVSSLVTTPERRFGLALIRREVTIGETVTAGGQPAEVTALPFATLS